MKFPEIAVGVAQMVPAALYLEEIKLAAALQEASRK